MVCAVVVLVAAVAAGVVVGRRDRAPTGPVAGWVPVAPAVLPVPAGGGFRHPGVLIGADELARVGARIDAGAEPWASAFAQMAETRYGDADWRPRARAVVECGPYSEPDLGCTEEAEDGVAAYTQALLWSLTGDERHARAATRIIDAWAAVLERHTNVNGPLQSAWSAVSMVRAAELIRHSGYDWDHRGAEAMFRDVFLPEVIEGATWTNGNWELIMMEAATGIAVFLDDRVTWDRAVERFRGRVRAYVYLAADGPLPVAPPGETDAPGDRLISYWQGQRTLLLRLGDGDARRVMPLPGRPRHDGVMTDVTVVGGGVIGLTAARRLREAGARVTVIAADPPEDTVSAVAAAVWYPAHQEADPRVLRWSATAYAEFTRQAHDGVPGVLLRRTRMLLRGPAGALPWWAPAAGEATVEDQGELRVLHFVAPLVEMPAYLSWLSRGLRIERRRVRDLGEIAGPVVNATGLGARELAGDDAVEPARGHVVLVENPGLTVSVRDEARSLYIHPRSRDVVLGGTFERGRGDLAPDPVAAAAIRARCAELEPRLATARTLGERIGLRPTRRDGPRLEREGHVIHCYGHGGAGMTMSWGCAAEVTELARGVF